MNSRTVCVYLAASLKIVIFPLLLLLFAVDRLWKKGTKTRRLLENERVAEEFDETDTGHVVCVCDFPLRKCVRGCVISSNWSFFLVDLSGGGGGLPPTTTPAPYYSLAFSLDPCNGFTAARPPATDAAPPSVIDAAA